MPFHFYLSYAPPEYSAELRRFFEDLTFTLQIRLGLPKDKEVGFFAQRNGDVNSQFSERAREALGTSQAMIALVSPQYLQSEFASNERQLFEARYGRADRQGPAKRGRADLSTRIAPVIWIPCPGQDANIVTASGNHLADSNSVYRKNGLLLMLKSLERFQREYVEVLVDLAEQITCISSAIELPPRVVTSPTEKGPIIPESRHQARLATTFESHPAQKYRVLVIDDEEQVRKFFVDWLDPLGFDVQAYSESEAQHVLARPFEDNSRPTLPDLIIVDLELEAGEMRGMDLIAQLTTNKVTSKILGMSASPSDSKLKEVHKRGAEDIIQKPFDVVRMEAKLKALAGIGMNQRLYANNLELPKPKDSLRDDRPVLLSYTRHDQRIASILRSQIEASGIGVWYDPDDLPFGDDLRERLLKAIDEVCVFVPLITNHYPGSPICMGKMVRFYRRLRTDKLPVLLPVLDGFIETIPNADLIGPILEDHAYADITSHRFADGLTAMLGRIQQAVKQCELSKSRMRSAQHH